MRVTLKTDDGISIDEIQMPHKRRGNLDLSKLANWGLFTAMLKAMFVARSERGDRVPPRPPGDAR